MITDDDDDFGRSSHFPPGWWLIASVLIGLIAIFAIASYRYF